MIDYKHELNPAQYEAATTLEGALLVIAGAGSGKTRTVVYRLAHLIQSGVPASSILLLTFTRRAAQEMLDRARLLVGQSDLLGKNSASIAQVSGGTFHSFAYSILRVFRPTGYAGNATLMDSADSLALVKHCRESLEIGKGDKSFPRNQKVQSILSKSKNCEREISDILRADSAHLISHAEALEKISKAYRKFKLEKSLLDYDDLLFELEKLLRSNVEALNYCRRRFHYIMVDEFQDTNLVQARITALLAGIDMGIAEAEAGTGNIMVVGDDAQSIYAFRGANVDNILHFPDNFPGCKLIRLEENYRSIQPVLDLSNAILDNAKEGFKKHLYTSRTGSNLPQVLRSMSDLSQGALVALKVVELLKLYPAEEIAVLFRAGYQSYHVEVQLNKLGIHFKKYGGIRYAEAAHIKDAMSFLRLVYNPLDFTAFQRITAFVRGIGPKTALRLHQALQVRNDKVIENACTKFSDFKKLLEFINTLRAMKSTPRLLLEHTLDFYQPFLEKLFPDDHPMRRQGLDALLQLSTVYEALDLFITDLSLDDPLSEVEKRDAVTFSTIHSAKGLEWSAVIIIDLVEGRFPSKHALTREDDYEEERRLMYVACTRAKDYLGLFVPTTLYDRASSGSIPVSPSPFISEIVPSLYEELHESFTGGWIKRSSSRGATHPSTKTAHSPVRSTISVADYCQGKNHNFAVKNGLSPDSSPDENLLVPKTSGEENQEADIFKQSLELLREQADSFKSKEDFSDTTTKSRLAAHGLTSHRPAHEAVTEQVLPPLLKPEDLGYCLHKIFGRGKVVKFISPDKYQVNFASIGLKVIMGAYLVMEK